MLGTPTYMSPEQARGRVVDRRTDVWAFGCVLFECLTGKRAFDGGSFSDVVAAILAAEPEWSALPKDTPSEVLRVLRRCLQRDQTRRARSLGDVALDLDPAQWGGVGAEPERRSKASRGLLVPALSAVAVVCAASLAWQLSRATESTGDKLPLALSLLLPDGLEVSDTVEISPDGRTLAFAANDALGEQHVYLRDLDDYALRRVASSRDGRLASFSPDSRSIVFFAHDGLYRASVAGGAPTELAGTHSLMGASWGEDDQIVYSTGEGSTLWSVPADGAAPPSMLTRLEDDPGAYAHAWPQHILGTRNLVFMTWAGGDQGGPRLMDLDTGTFRALTVAQETIIAPPTRWSDSGHLIFENWNEGILAQAFDPAGEGMVSLGSARQLLEDVANMGDSTRSCFSLSRGGTLAYVPAVLDRQRLVWVDLDGTTEVLLEGAEIADYSNLSGNLALSRDGLRALVGGIDELVEIDLERKLPRRLTHNSGNDTNPYWSADETRVVYRSNRGERWSIWSINANGASDPELVLGRDGNIEVTSIGSDGALLFSESGEGTRFDVWMLEAGGEARALAATPANEREAAFSPDGTRVALQSDLTGIDEVYVLPVTGTGAPLQVSRGGGRSPKWGPGGRSLYFRRGRTVMRVSMNEGRPNGEAKTVFEGPLLLPGACYDISSDETRLLAVEIDESSLLDEIRVVTDFFEEIRRITGQ